MSTRATLAMVDTDEGRWHLYHELVDGQVRLEFPPSALQDHCIERPMGPGPVLRIPADVWGQIKDYKGHWKAGSYARTDGILLMERDILTVDEVRRLQEDWDQQHREGSTGDAPQKPPGCTCGTAARCQVHYPSWPLWPACGGLLGAALGMLVAVVQLANWLDK